jgi:ABC-type multidrug transport system ATPase subunit
MLTIRDLKMSYGGRVLFEGASFQVNYGDRVALVGPNGAGKSTLFSIILKEREPDEGDGGARSVDHGRLSAAGRRGGGGRDGAGRGDGAGRRNCRAGAAVA